MRPLLLAPLYQPGDWVMVEYPVDPGVQHERLIVLWGAGAWYQILTPDGDHYMEELSAPPLSTIRRLPPNRRYRRVRGMYTFDDGPHEIPSVCEFRVLQQEAMDEVNDWRREWRLKASFGETFRDPGAGNEPPMTVLYSTDPNSAIGDQVNNVDFTHVGPIAIGGTADNVVVPTVVMVVLGERPRHHPRLPPPRTI